MDWELCLDELLSDLRGEPTRSRRTGPNGHDKLVARSAKLRRRHRELTDQLALAAAEIQRLSLLLGRYVAAAEENSKVTHISNKRTGR
ncbi:hypothetical protein [Streptomyces lavendofoliae]|uniref:hypothetical protein n=1 Tax=Streptomyces lavendofoliae TaxID=67314 RepID=UPI00300EBACB